MISGNGGTDRLVAESERLREELLRMAARLEVFAEGLTGEAQCLREEAGEPRRPGGNDHEQRDDAAGTGTDGSEPGGPADPDGGRADGRGGNTGP